MFTFPCGSPALDFAGTLKSRDTAPRETLAAATDLEQWVRESAVVDDSPEFESLDAPLELREAIYDLLTARMTARPYDATSLTTVNGFAAQPPPTTTLSPAGSRTTATPEQLLSLLARDAITLVSGPDAALLKQCGRHGCTQVYLDRSRGGRREWCSMQTCGNRVKASTYRARQASASASPAR